MPLVVLMTSCWSLWLIDRIPCFVQHGHYHVTQFGGKASVDHRAKNVRSIEFIKRLAEVKCNRNGSIGAGTHRGALKRCFLPVKIWDELLSVVSGCVAVVKDTGDAVVHISLQKVSKIWGCGVPKP